MLSSKLSKRGTGHGRQAHLTMLGRSAAIKPILLYACNVKSLIQRALFPAWSLNFLLRSELPDSTDIPSRIASSHREDICSRVEIGAAAYAGPSTLIDVTVAMKHRWNRRSGSGGWLSQSSLPLRKCFLKPWGPEGALTWLGSGPCGLDVEPRRQDNFFQRPFLTW